MSKTSGYFAGVCLFGALNCSVLGQRLERTILPGDLLAFSCENRGDLCVSRIVNFDGKVLLPGVGAVGVATLTPTQIKEKVEILLRETVETASARLAVKSCFLQGEAIGIEGAISHPIHLRFNHGVALAELLQDAGPTDLADLFRIEISHADGGDEFVSSKSTLRLIDGDRVLVQRSATGHTIEVVGGVNKPQQLDFQDGMSLGDALSAADGLAPRGIGSRVSVERMGETIPVTLPDDNRFRLEIGDRVRVEVGPDLPHVVVEGGVAHPGLVDLVSGMTLSQAIAEAGGLKGGSRLNDMVWLKRNSSGGKPAPIKLSYRFILTKRIPDPILSPNDVIQVGSSDLKSSR